MRLISLILCCMLLLCPILSPSAALAKGKQEVPLSTAEEQEKAEKDAFSAVDALLRRYATLGASIAIIENGQITHTHTYGVERIDGADVTPDTLFRVGSISKMVSSIGLLQLLDEKGISLDTPLGDLLGYDVHHPDYPNTPITLRQLMTHTASLRDSRAYDDAADGKQTSLKWLLQKHTAHTFYSAWEPGTHRMYSNFGGGIIGSLIETLSGQQLDAYMAQHVFEPLGITAAYQPGLMEGSIAPQYQMPERRITHDFRNETDVADTPDPDAHFVYTAGKLIISAPGLAKVLIALCDGGVCGDARILKESTALAMITPQNCVGSVSCETGSGLFVNIVPEDVVPGRTMIGHGGKAGGMLCAAYFDPTDRTGVVMLTNGCNNTDMYNSVGMLSRQLITLCYEQIISPNHTTEDPFEVE